MRITIALSLIVCLINACATRESQHAGVPETPASVRNEPRRPAIAGHWVLQTLNARSITASSAPDITIDAAGKASGRGGVNAYSAIIDTEALRRGAFSLQSFTSTEMAGSPEARKLEAEFFGALQSAARVNRENDRLILSDASGKPVAVFVRKP